MEEFASYFALIQKTCLPGVWSKGVGLARSNSVIADAFSAEESEWKFRVHVLDKTVSPKVTLWPEDEDWYCDCSDPNDVCPHVAAVVIALKTGSLKSQPSGAPAADKQPYQGIVTYRFTRQKDLLSLDRFIVFGDSKELLLTDSLVSFVGGVQSGRIKAGALAITKEDFAIDGVLLEKRRGTLDRKTWVALFKPLSACTQIFLDGQVVSVSSKPFGLSAQIVDENQGFRLKQATDISMTEAFTNGVMLCDNTLRAVEIPALTQEERSSLEGKGRYFAGEDIKILLTSILPSLERKMPVEVLAKKLPTLKIVQSKITLRIEKFGDALEVVPVLGTQTESKQNSLELFVTDETEERQLLRKLQSELQLSPGQRTRFEGDTALRFLDQAKNWEFTGNLNLLQSTTLAPTISFEANQFQISFHSQGNGEATSLDSQTVLRAWRENRNFIPLLNGGWAALPKDWLTRYAEQIEDLLAAKNARAETPPYLLPEIAKLCTELGQEYPDTLKKLTDHLDKVDGIQKADLPSDLEAELRPYQQIGVNWLSFLRNGKMGAMLADDMGLGKTLQTLCAIEGRTLIISPTSVLFSWAKQIEQFRKKLTYSLYYGPQRKLNPNAQVVLTSYAVARLDQAKLIQEKWDTIVIDEAQTIKNPDSQTTRMVHSLNADFRIALSGTPLENRLEDLWSQFHFINPGLLGTLESFQDRYALPISQGDRRASQFLREKVKPFILRRLKKDVASDLPPKIEKTLYCEFSTNEGEIYQSLLASTRSEVLSKLEEGGSIFAALELLLRLRQTCCHASLVPGTEPLNGPSAKTQLLLQTLQESLDCGHRALIFSQWTSYLDTIEPHLSERSIRFSRLDGTTPNRSQVVDEFQKDSGPSVMLLSLKAGGVGLTLTAADHIFLMDPWWNPAVEDQAADRAHRIGQTQTVVVHKLVAKETIEERILELQKSKQALAASILEGTGSAGTLTREDILSLLK